MARIGVFICWCGENIARTVDVEQVAAAAGELPGVACAMAYKYMCSDPGQALIRQKIAAERLTGVVVASCSPHMHLRTFRKAAAKEGLNPYLVEMANIREHCSWVHHDREQATAKAIDLIRMAVAKVALQPCPGPDRDSRSPAGPWSSAAAWPASRRPWTSPTPATRSCWSSASRRSAARWPACARPSPRWIARSASSRRGWSRSGQHPNITLHTYSEVESVEGYVGNFRVTIRKKARYVDMEKCTGCGQCWNSCPSKKNPSAFDYGLGQRTAIYIPFPQAVPARPVIDRDACLKLTKGKCGICAKKCQAGAIRFDDEDRLVTEEVGAIVVATGYKLYSIGKEQRQRPRDRLRRIRLRPLCRRDRLAAIRAAGLGLRAHRRRDPPAFRRQSAARRVVFISCVGSRDNAKGLSYCSKICCMYNAKHTMLYKHKVHDGRGPRLLHGHPRRRQELRRVRPPGDRAGRGPLPSRPRVEDHRGRRPTDRPRRRYAGRRAADDRGRPGRAGRGDVPVRRRRGAGPEAQRRLRRKRLPLRIAPQAAAGRNQRGGRLRLRRLPGAQGHSRVGRPGHGRGGQGAGDVQPPATVPRAGNRPGQRNELCGLLRLRPGVSLRRHRAGRDPRPQGATRQAHGPGQSRACAWAAAPAWPCAPRRAPTWTASPNNRSTPWWRAWYERSPRVSNRRSSPTSATGVRTWAPTWPARTAWSIRPTSASSACPARGGSTST